MVATKSKSALLLGAFLLPAFLVYFLFFILPFIQGIGISFTNWDGKTSKIPNSLTEAEFKTTILDKVSPEDQQVLLSHYRLENGRYLHQGITGWDRFQVEGILSKAHWEPQNYRFIGVDNYTRVLTGQVSPETFLPQTYQKTDFTETSALVEGLSFPVETFDSKVLAKLTNPQDLALMKRAFARDPQGKTYQFNPQMDELKLKDRAGDLKIFDIDQLDQFMKQAQAAGSQGKSWTLPAGLTPEVQTQLQTLVQEAQDLGHIKQLLASLLVETKLKMGVLGFTLFFTLLNVLLTNLLAFILAMALDRKIRSKNALRSSFFLPNVLSLVIVAYIWDSLFRYFLGPMTGITQWMSDPDKAPWLIILVSVWQGAGYLMVIYLAGLQSIPGEIIEAAEVDGAGWGHRLKHIVLPLLLPAFTICLFLSIANSLKAFDLIYILSGGPTSYTTGTVNFVMDIYFEYSSRNNAGLATAKAIILMVVILGITGFQLTVMKKKEVEY